MESVQPRADAATRYGPLTATTDRNNTGSATVDTARQCGQPLQQCR